MSSRILLTTRLHAMELDGLAGCEQKDLTALDPDDAVSFFHAEGVPGTRADIQEAYAPYGYHPLALRLLAGLIVKDKRQPGDIRVAARHRVIGELKGKEKHHILQVAYDALEPPRRDLLSRIAAFRSPINYESLAALNRFKDEKRFEQALDELIDRGVLLFDRGPARYDLHPVVRQYAYDRLTDKARVHARLRDYFEKIEAPGEHQIERRKDLDPVIELYHHTLKAHQYDEALDLFRDRLQYWLNFRFGAYQTCIELLKGLFSAGEDVPVRLKTDRAQAGALAMLADSYARSRQPGQAVALYRRAARIHKKSGNTMRVARDLGAAGFSQLALGDFREADANFREQIRLSREISDELGEAHGQRRLGRLEAYQGRVPESTAALDFSLSVFSKSGYKQQQGIAWAYIAALKLLNHNPDEALEACSQARQLAGAESGERDIIRTEWLLGWADTEKSLSNAEAHLTEALTRCRRINLIESEPDILLTWTRWHRAAGHPKEARECLNHALAIADRSEYRLVQADARNLLARLALDAGDSSEARRHAEIAKERAWCDGPPHCYKPALDEAERLLAQAAP